MFFFSVIRDSRGNDDVIKEEDFSIMLKVNHVSDLRIVQSLCICEDKIQLNNHDSSTKLGVLNLLAFGGGC